MDVDTIELAPESTFQSYKTENSESRGRQLIRRGLVELRAALMAMVAVLLSFGTALLLVDRAGLSINEVVVAVALSWMLARAQRNADLHNRLLSFAVLPVAAIVAAAVGSLIDEHPTPATGLLITLIGLTILPRRFGPRATMVGSVAVLPLVTVLIARPAHVAGGVDAPWWAAIIAFVVCWWVTIVHVVAGRLGLKEPGPAVRVDASPPRQPGGRRRLSVPTRMAVQMAVALGVSFTVAQWVLRNEWTWAVLTTFIVCSGAQGRAEALHKGVLRMLGVAVGTVAATLLAVGIGPGRVFTIVLVFVVLAVGTWLRSFGYAYWAGSITGVLALTYGYFGQASAELLRDRLLAILVGAVLGVATCWVVLPIRTADVVRRRVADAVRAIGDFLGAERWESDALEFHRAVFDVHLRRLNQIARPLEIQRHIVGLWQGSSQNAEAISALRRCARPLRTIVACAAEYGGELKAAPNVARLTTAVQANVVTVRLLLARQGGRRYEHLPPRGRVRVSGDAQRARLRSRTAVSIATIDTAMSRLASAYQVTRHSP